MDSIQQNLERSYNLFIGRESQLGFFKGLSEYIDYVYQTPKLKVIFDAYITERDKHKQKIENLESVAYAELQEVKKKLLAIIKKEKLDRSAFKRFSTFSIPPFDNVLDELETNAVLSGKFPSDHLEHLLADVASNIRALGHEEAVKGYIASRQDYTAYYARINGTDGFMVTGNEYGNFIFSKTWPDYTRRL